MELSLEQLNTLLDVVIEMFSREKRNKILEMRLTDEDKNDMNASVCCNDEEKREIISLMKGIKTIPEFSTLVYADICVILVYIYYSLHYNEQTRDTFGLKYLKRNLYNKELGLKLYFDLTIGDVIVGGNNLSSYLRRKLLNMRGGEKSKKYKRRKTRKLRRNKGRKTRSYKR